MVRPATSVPGLAFAEFFTIDPLVLIPGLSFLTASFLADPITGEAYFPFWLYILQALLVVLILLVPGKFFFSFLFLGIQDNGIRWGFVFFLLVFSFFIQCVLLH